MEKEKNNAVEKAEKVVNQNEREQYFQNSKENRAEYFTLFIFYFIFSKIKENRSY